MTSMTNTDRALSIGIARLDIVSEMAKALKIAKTKDDMLYITQRMLDQLEQGLAEIDQVVGAEDSRVEAG